MTVIGSAGGEEKCAFVRELGADAAIDTKRGRSVKALVGRLPRGSPFISTMSAATSRRRLRGGAAERALRDLRDDRQLQWRGTAGLRYIMRTIAARIQIKGFIYTDFLPQIGDFYRDMGGWIASGQVKSRETVPRRPRGHARGLPRVFRGANIGKMLVRL